MRLYSAATELGSGWAGVLHMARTCGSTEIVYLSWMQGGQHALRIASSSGPSAYDTGAVALAAGAHFRQMNSLGQPGTLGAVVVIISISSLLSRMCTNMVVGSSKSLFQFLKN